MEIDLIFASGAVVERATTHSWGRRLRAAREATGDPKSAWWRVQPRLLTQKRGQFLQLHMDFVYQERHRYTNDVHQAHMNIQCI